MGSAGWTTPAASASLRSWKTFLATFAKKVVDGLRSLDAVQRDDTYVVSFFVYDEQDDPRLPTLKDDSTLFARPSATLRKRLRGTL